MSDTPSIELQRSVMELCQERDQLKAEVALHKAAFLESVKLRAEVERLRREIAMLRMHPDLVRERCDAWRAVADELACGLRIWHDSDMDSKHPALAAYEKLKGQP